MSGIYHIHAEGKLNRARSVESLTGIESCDCIAGDGLPNFNIIFTWAPDSRDILGFRSAIERDGVFKYALNVWKEARKGEIACFSLLSDSFSFFYSSDEACLHD